MILEKEMNRQWKDWASRLMDALWAYWTAFKTLLGFSPYQLVYGKMCHLPVKIDHHAEWAIREVNVDMREAKLNRLMKLEELEEWRRKAYSNSKLYKKRLKELHDRSIKAKTLFTSAEHAFHDGWKHHFITVLDRHGSQGNKKSITFHDDPKDHHEKYFYDGYNR